MTVATLRQCIAALEVRADWYRAMRLAVPREISDALEELGWTCREAEATGRLHADGRRP